MVVWALDDVELVRRMKVRLLASIPGNIGYCVQGGTDQEIKQFASMVLLASPAVDIVILDNILTSPTHSAPTVYGLDIANALVRDGFLGMIVMSSANELVHEYMDMPKGLPFAAKRKILIAKIHDVLEKRDMPSIDDSSCFASIMPVSKSSDIVCTISNESI